MNDILPGLVSSATLQTAPPAPSPDPINPAHYRTGAVEVIDVIRQQLGDDAFVGYCRGNAIKYQCRAGKKATPAAEDYAKAAWYAQMAAHVLAPAAHADPRAPR